jgi:hypothetical protein
MIEKLLRSLSCLSILLTVVAVMGQTAPKGAQGGTPAGLPPPRAIPGITAKDQFPRACVDCHLNYPEQKMDARFSTFMKQWTQKVEPQLLAKAAASAPPGVKLKGQHPAVLGALKNIPTACLMCHGRTSTMAPPFARMLHAIHLTGGKDNHFLTVFQGECTHCHKLNAATGAWSLPSGPER